MKLLLAGLAVALLVLVGCSAEGGSTPSGGSPSPSPSLSDAVQLAAQYGLHVRARTGGFIDAVPDHPMANPGSGLIDTACADIGFDLGPYRGEQVTFTSYAMDERLHGSTASFWTIERDGRIVGAYVTIKNADPSTLSLKELEAQL